MKKTAMVLISIVTWVLSSTISPSLAQDNYPTRPIRILVGTTPGASQDIIGRLLAQKLAAQMGANAIVDNKAGASGVLANEIVVAARPDGHTLLFNASSIVLSSALGQPRSYDVFKDFTPVSLVVSVPLALIVYAGVPANTVAEFIAYAKANPDKLAFGSTGPGGIAHLGPLLFLQAHGLTALHVPYKGTPELMVDLIAGRVQFRFGVMTGVVPLVKEKRIKVLAMTGLKHTPLMPEVPTLSESGMPGFEIGNWFGMLAPAKTPPAIVKRINVEIARALQDADAKSRLAQENAEPVGSTPEEYGAYMRSESVRWTKVVKSAGVKLQ